MSATLTYVGDHRLVSSAASNLVKLPLLNNLEVAYSAEPRPLDLRTSSLAVTAVDDTSPSREIARRFTVRRAI